MRFKEFLEGFIKSQGVVPAEHKLLYKFPPYDISLYMKFSGRDTTFLPYLIHHGIKPSDVLAARIIQARYSYLRPDLQRQAEQHGTYFSDVKQDVPGNPGKLFIKGKYVLDLNTNITELYNYLTRYSTGPDKTIDILPLIVRFGGERNPTSNTGITLSRLNNGMRINYHARGHQEEV